MTLKDLLFTMNGPLTYLDTNNETFPKELRSEFVHCADLYMKIRKSTNEDEILNKSVSNISLNYRPIIVYQPGEMIEAEQYACRNVRIEVVLE